jgi:xyloglucan-specific exo-beta-1,4-glucanase
MILACAGPGSCGGGGSSAGTTQPPPPPPASTPQTLTIGAPGTSLLSGDTLQLSASSKYSDGSTKDVTSTVGWSITSGAAATITAQGLLSTSGPGDFAVTASLAGLSASLSFHVANPLPVTAGASGFSWSSVNIQGMGYVTGLVIHPLAPNDIYIRTDVGGAYRFDRTAQQWLPLLDAFGRSQANIYGVESVAVDPSNANTVYIAAADGWTVSGSNVQSSAEVLVSHDRGATWTATGLAAQKLYIGANDSYRGTTGERLAVDPNDPDVVFFASRENGLWRGVRTSGDQFQWQAVSGGLPAPAASPGVTFVLFDKSGGTSASGETLNLYAGVYGSGVYASTDAGSTWTQIASTANPVRGAIASDGTLFVSFGGDEGATAGGLGRYKGLQWQDITPPQSKSAYAGIAVDPADPRNVVAALNANRALFRSTDGGTTWTAVTAATPDADTPPYYPAGAGGWGNAALAIDPANSKRVWQTNGYGVLETEDITAAQTSWKWQMANLEELVVQKVKAPPVVTVPGTNTPGADLLSAVADMVGFRHASRDVVPQATIDSFAYVAQGTSISYCASQPQSAVFVGWDETNASSPMSGITADNGLTWKHIPNTKPGSGGNIAMAADDPNRMVWAPSGASPMYTSDGGSTWNPATVNGAPLPAAWQLSNPWWNGEVLAADQVAPGTFYYFNNGDLYASADGGATWTNRGVAWPQDPHWVIDVSIVPNPVKAGDLWMTFAPNTNQTVAYQLIHSTDGGKTFVAVATLQYANFVAFGKGNDVSAPFIYAHGRAPGDSADAIYKSEDMGVTWTRISDPSTMQFGEINSLEGDMRTRDLVYVGESGRGIVFGYGPNSGVVRAGRRGSHTQ